MSKNAAARKRAIRRTLWPLVYTLASVAIYHFHEPALAAVHLDIDATLIRMLSGAASYFSAAWLGGRLISLALERAGDKKRPVPKLLLELLSAALFVAASVATIMLVAGQSLSGALAGSGIVLAIFGFAIRNVLADVMSGVAVGIEAPYRIGDWVSIDDATRGRVIEIGWRTTRVLTHDSTYVILPNSRIARQKLTNYSAPRRHYRTRVEITLSHRISVVEAKALLAEAAGRPSIILPTPRPDVRVASYDARGVRYLVRFWVPTFADDVECRDAVFSEIDAALRTRSLLLPVNDLGAALASSGLTMGGGGSAGGDRAE